MKELSQFCAVHSSGLLMPSQSTVTALALIFEKVHLPRNIELVVEFAQTYRFSDYNPELEEMDLRIDARDPGTPDPFGGLGDAQKLTAHLYLKFGLAFIRRNIALFRSVFETEAFEGSEPINVKLVKKGAPGELNTYECSMNPLVLSGEDTRTIPRLLQAGYVPVATFGRQSRSPSKTRATDLASLLAMKSVELVLPSTKAAHPETILEARERLGDQLPPFWSSMLKLSIELRKRIRDEMSAQELDQEAHDLVNTVVRPALIDLCSKLEKERKNWFFKILSPIQKGLRIFIGNPPLTQQQLITNAMLLASDVAMSTVENMKTIEALKQECGLTYLLDLNESLRRKPSSPPLLK